LNIVDEIGILERRRARMLRGASSRGKSIARQYAISQQEKTIFVQCFGFATACFLT